MLPCCTVSATGDITKSKVIERKSEQKNNIKYKRNSTAIAQLVQKEDIKYGNTKKLVNYNNILPESIKILINNNICINMEQFYQTRSGNKCSSKGACKKKRNRMIDRAAKDGIESTLSKVLLTELL